MDLHERVEHDLTNHPPAGHPAPPPAPPGSTGALLDEVTLRCKDLGHWLVDNVPAGREQSLALTQLEQLSMWAKAGIARNQS